MHPIPITCIAKSNDRLGEGCVWDVDTQSLWWLDIPLPSRIHRFEPTTGAHRSWQFNVLLTAMAFRADGSLLTGGEHGLYVFDPISGALNEFSQPENRVGNRGNDGACDASGRFWFGTMQQNIGPSGKDLDITRNSGALYRVEKDGTSKLMVDGVGVSNGPCWSPDDKTFYFSDSRAQIIWAFDFDLDSGDISNRRIHNDSKDYGYPDGAAVDAEGYVWSARWDGSCVLRIDPKGRIDRAIQMPASRPTCVCFGGPALDVIYVTSSRAHVAGDVLAQYPLQGGVFCFDPKVKGFAKHRFGG
jgi:sugar lactone lactonase YvrE